MLWPSCATSYFIDYESHKSMFTLLTKINKSQTKDTHANPTMAKMFMDTKMMFILKTNTMML
jgi:hypothetical protein